MFVLGLLGRTEDAFKLLDKAVKDFPDSPVIKRMADPRGLKRTFQQTEFKELAL